MENAQMKVTGYPNWLNTIYMYRRIKVILSNCSRYGYLFPKQPTSVVTNLHFFFTLEIYSLVLDVMKSNGFMSSQPHIPPPKHVCQAMAPESVELHTHTYQFRMHKGPHKNSNSPQLGKERFVHNAIYNEITNVWMFVTYESIPQRCTAKNEV